MLHADVMWLIAKITGTNRGISFQIGKRSNSWNFPPTPKTIYITERQLPALPTFSA